MEEETMLERDQFHAAATTAGVPPHLVDGLTRYVYDRCKPGSFLLAVLCNDLMNTLLRGDPASVAALPALCRFIHNEVPIGWFGSARFVEQHLLGFVAHNHAEGS
jgi:hypothetical protein